MKRQYLAAIIVVLGIALSPGASALADPANLALSPGFEDGIQGWTGYPSLPIHRSTDFVHSGHYSLKLPQNGDGPGHPVTGMQSMPYPVLPGARYRCSIFVRADEKTEQSASVSIDTYEGPYGYNKPAITTTIPADGQWHEASLDVAIPDFVDRLTIGIHAKGTVWLDDYSIVQSAAPAIKPFDAVVDAPQYVTRKAPVAITVTVRNNTDSETTINLNLTAQLPNANSPEAKPVRGYGKLLKAWPVNRVVLPAHAAVKRSFTLDLASLSDTGIKLDAAVATPSGESLATGTREIFLAERPDYHTWYSIGAQCYTSNRYDGSWVRNLVDLGGDSVRECLPLPMSYRNAAPEQWTDTSFEDRLSYYARWGIKWLSAYHALINNTPAWVSENPANRRWRFDGTILDKPCLCYHAPEARAALMKDAELGGAELSRCPDVFGVQVDNEINAFDCYCPDAQASFRAYVKADFGTIEAVNKAWGTTFASFDDVKQPAPIYSSYWDDPAGMLDMRQPEKRIPAKDFVWLKWREKSFIDYYRDWTAHYKKTAGNLPVTDNFSLYVSTLPRFYYAAPVDLFQFATFFDVGAVDCGPSLGHDAQYVNYQFDWVNSAWGDRPVWVPEIYYDWEKSEPHALGFDLVYGMGRKVQHTNIFTWPVISNKFGGPYADDLRKDRSYMLDNIKSDIAQARKFDSEVHVASLHYVAPPAAIYWSSSIHHFGIAEAGQDCLAGTDPLYDLDKVFTDLQYPVRFVDARTFPASAQGVRALFVGGMQSLSSAQWQSMLAYAKSGGLLVLNGAIGRVDEHLTPFASSPCGQGAQIGIELNDWHSALVDMYSDGVSPLVKLGKNRKVRGFGEYATANISPAWRTLLRTSAGMPGVVTRPYGNGRIVWALTDIANPYGTYQTSNTLYFIEGLLESAEIGRPVRIMDASRQAGAPHVSVAVKRRTDTETYVFVNNFGPEGDFVVDVNLPLKGLTIDEVPSGKRIAWNGDKGGASFTQHFATCGYAIYRVRSTPIDLAHLAVRSPLPAPPALAQQDGAKAHRFAPQICSLTENKVKSGTMLFWLNGPFTRAAISPTPGGRIAYLSSATDDVSDVIAPSNTVGAEGLISASDGGIKPVIALDGRGYPGPTVDAPFTIASRQNTPEVASVTMTSTLPKENVTLTQMLGVSRANPGINCRVAQGPLLGKRTMGLILHSVMLLGGEVKRQIDFVAGNGGGEALSIPYKLGSQSGIEPTLPVTWCGVVDPSSAHAVLCVYRKGYNRVRFWNGMSSYNVEPASVPVEVDASAKQEGEADFYNCSGLREINFVASGLAGSFRCWPEAGGQSVSVSLCGLTGNARKVDLVVVGIKNGEQKDLGSIGVDVRPVDATAKALSLGGSGSGYDVYRLCERTSGGLVTLKETGSSDVGDSSSQVSEIASWAGSGDAILSSPEAAKPQIAWDLASGTVRVRFKTPAARDIVKNGVDLVNGYHGEIDYNQNRKSRLWLNIHGLAEWSPVTPMIFLMIYDKDGHRIHITANATLRDETWYDLSAAWDTKTKMAMLLLNGQGLKMGECVFPDEWNGAEPLETITFGGARAQIGALSILSSAVIDRIDE